MAVQDEEVDVMCATDNSSTYFECRTLHLIPAGKQVHWRERGREGGREKEREGAREELRGGSEGGEEAGS